MKQHSSTDDKTDQKLKAVAVMVVSGEIRFYIFVICVFGLDDFSITDDRLTSLQNVAGLFHPRFKILWRLILD